MQLEFCKNLCLNYSCLYRSIYILGDCSCRHYQKGSGHYQKGSGHYQKGSGHYQKGSGHYQKGSGHYQKGSGHSM